MRGCKSRTQWDEKRFMEAAGNCELVPQADPNTASMGQRVMKVQGLAQLQTAFPNLMDPVAIVSAAIRAIGWANPEQFMVSKEARAAPPPQMQEMQQKMANEKTEADAKATEANARAKDADSKAKETDAKIGQGAFQPKTGVAPAQEPPPTPLEIAGAQAKIIDAHTHAVDARTRAQQVGLEAARTKVEDENRDQDRAAKERDAMIGLAKELIEQPKTSTTGADGKKSTSGGAPKSTNAGAKAVKIKKQIDKSIGKKGES